MSVRRGGGYEAADEVQLKDSMASYAAVVALYTVTPSSALEVERQKNREK